MYDSEAILSHYLLLTVSSASYNKGTKNMIRFFLLQNKQGNTRLSKWYATAPEDTERIKMEADIHRTIAKRAKGNTNFVEVPLDSFVPSNHF